MDSRDTRLSRSCLRGTVIGSLFLIAFGLFWATVGILSLDNYQLTVSLIVASISLVLLLAARAARSTLAFDG